MYSLSIITVCLNISNTIERTLKSISGQTWQEFEWIVIDGGSTDGTLEKLGEYNNRINRLVSGKDRGIYNAMNKGISLADGDYLLFINGGDYLFDRSTLEKLKTETLTENIYYGDVMVFNSSGESYLMKMPGAISEEFHYFKTLPHQSTLIRKDLFSRIGNYDESLKIVADYDFTVKAMKHFGIIFHYLDMPISWFLPDGISHNEKTREAEKDQVRKRYFSFTERINYRYRLRERYLVLRNHIGRRIRNSGAK